MCRITPLPLRGALKSPANRRCPTAQPPGSIRAAFAVQHQALPRSTPLRRPALPSGVAVTRAGSIAAADPVARYPDANAQCFVAHRGTREPVSSAHRARRRHALASRTAVTLPKLRDGEYAANSCALPIRPDEVPWRYFPSISSKAFLAVRKASIVVGKPA